jgi:alcohol dehydrogenase class IV
MPFSLLTPGRSVFGEGALESCMDALRALGQKPLLVTGPTTVKRDAFTRLTAVLDGVPCAVFSDIPSEPDDKMVAAGADVYRAEGCDCIIAIGGGSALDCAKAIAVSAALPGNICDLAGTEIAADVPPFALIPTTSGTGSEVTKYTVITQSETNAKLLLKGDALLPRLAVVDYTLTVSMPAKLTAYTGMDALTHALEAYTSKRANPVSDPLAVDAVKRCFESLPIVCRDGEAMADRESMAIAAYEAGVCICNASVTIVHGMSRPIGAKFHVPHGLSNAMLLAPCLAFAAKGAPERFACLARAVGFASAGQSDADAAQALIDQLKRLTKVLAIPSPEDYGIPKAEFLAAAEQMAAEAIQSGSPANTRCPVMHEDIVTLYHSLY